MSIRHSGRFVAPVRRNDKDEPISIIIPSAGAGYRIKYYGAKSLIQLNENENILQRQLRILKALYSKADLMVVVGFQADKVISSIPGVKTVENERYEETNVTRSVSIALRAMPERKTLIVYGDLIFNEAAFSFPTNQSAVVLDNTGQMKSREVGAVVQDGIVHNFGYSLPDKWCHIMLLCGNELELFKSIVHERNNGKLFLHEVLNEVIDAGGVLQAVYPQKMKIREIDTSKEIEAIQDK